ncbi:hypothetical protein Tco_1495392 [Tanacetum coccineum]
MNTRSSCLFPTLDITDLLLSSAIGSSLQGEAAQPSLFISAWKLTPHSKLNDVESCRDMMIHLATTAIQDQHIRLSDHQALQRAWFELGHGALAQIDLLQRYEALSDDYGDLYDTHRSCEEVSDRLTKTQLVDVVRSRDQLADDHKNLQQEHLSCAGKEVGLVEKLVVVEKEKDDVLDKNREQGERIKQPQSGGNSVGWSEGVKVERNQEEAEAILADAANYDPYFKDTFILFCYFLAIYAFDFVYYLALGTCPYPERLAFRELRHLAIGTWTHPERLAFRELYVTWPLSLGLIRNVLRSRNCTSLGHWHLDSSGTFYIPGIVRHLAIGTWTHSKRFAFRELYVT